MNKPQTQYLQNQLDEEDEEEYSYSNSYNSEDNQEEQSNSCVSSYQDSESEDDDDDDNDENQNKSIRSISSNTSSNKNNKINKNTQKQITIKKQHSQNTKQFQSSYKQNSAAFYVRNQNIKKPESQKYNNSIQKQFQKFQQYQRYQLEKQFHQQQQQKQAQQGQKFDYEQKIKNRTNQYISKQINTKNSINNQGHNGFTERIIRTNNNKQNDGLYQNNSECFTQGHHPYINSQVQQASNNNNQIHIQFEDSLSYNAPLYHPYYSQQQQQKINDFKQIQAPQFYPYVPKQLQRQQIAGGNTQDLKGKKLQKSSHVKEYQLLKKRKLVLDCRSKQNSLQTFNTQQSTQESNRYSTTQVVKNDPQNLQETIQSIKLKLPPQQFPIGYFDLPTNNSKQNNPQQQQNQQELEQKNYNTNFQQNFHKYQEGFKHNSKEQQKQNPKQIPQNNSEVQKETSQRKQSAKQNPEIKNQETEKNIKHKQPLAPRKKGSSLSIRYSKSVILSYSHTKSQSQQLKNSNNSKNNNINIKYQENNINKSINTSQQQLQIFQQQQQQQLQIPDLTCRYYTILDLKNNQIIASRNENSKREVASLTKILTAYCANLLINKFQIDPKQQTTKISKYASSICGTSAHLQKNDIVSIHDLFHGLMLPSGNDSALALGQFFGQKLFEISKQYKAKLRQDPDFCGKLSPKKAVLFFVKFMNRQCQILDLQDSTFQNPHGLCSKPNRSTAYDIAKLSFYFTNEPYLSNIVKKQKYECQIYNEDSNEKRNVIWNNTNKLLQKNGYIGLKTGITKIAGPCLCSWYKDSQREYIIVILNSKSRNERWEDTEKIVQYITTKNNNNNTKQ